MAARGARGMSGWAPRWNNARMPKWIRSYWDEEDTTFLWEVGDDGWVTRSIELTGPEHRPQAAAALDEVLQARDTGGLPAVQAYERQYGVASEKPIVEWDFAHEEIDQAQFDRSWAEPRRSLEG